MDKISIIVPVWNAEKYLDNCVRSIQNQTYTNLEIILVDDGSSDSSYSMCQKYAEQDKRIIVLHKENGGQASARNMGLDNATGAYIGFIDNDDFPYPEMYEKLYQYLIKYNADVARCSDCIDETDKPIENIRINIMEKDEIFGALYQDELGGHVTDRLFKSEVIGQNRFPYSKTIEDMRFMRLLLPSIGREVSTNEKLYFYTIHENNTSFIYARNHINSYERAMEYQDRYLEAKKYYPQYRKLLLCKATTFSCGTLRQLWKDKNNYRNEYNNLLNFLKNNKKSILAIKDLGVKYKMFVLFL